MKCKKFWLVILLFCNIISIPMYAQIENIPLITVVGESVLKVKPDYVILGLRIERGLKKDNVYDFCSAFEIFCKEETKIKLFDFDEKNIDESFLQIKKSIYFKEIYIQVMDLNKLEKCILELHKLGYKDYIYFDYRIKNLSALKNQSKKDAIKSAMEKASLLATELNQKVGKAHLIEEIESEDYNWYTIQKEANIENISFKQGFGNYLIDPGYISVTSRIKVSFDLIK